MIDKIAKFIRAATIPPIMVFGLVLLLYFQQSTVFTSTTEFIWTTCFLMFVPVLAYPISCLPKFKIKGRDRQRKLAFVFSLAGYSLGLLYALIFHVNRNLRIVFLTYFLSVVILTLLNKIAKIKASGHACSIAGPLALIIYFIGLQSVIWCVVVFGLVIWSSVQLKRHTVSELVFGSITAMFAFFISVCV